MANLIPPSAKKSVVIEYWLRVITVWSLIASVCTLLFAVSFLPLYVLVNSKVEAYQKSAEIASQKIASFESVSEDLRRATEQAQLVMISAKEKSLYSTVELFTSLERENAGIQLEEIQVGLIARNTLAPVQMSGTATNRQALADFRDSLLAQEGVAAVDLPLSNLAKDRDINFSITVTMSNPIAP